MKKKIVLYSIVISVLIIVLVFLIVAFSRSYYYEGKKISYKDFIVKDDYWTKYVIKFVPEKAKNIYYKINLTGLVFELSFQIQKDQMGKYIDDFSKPGTTVPFEGHIINFLSESIDIRKGVYWKKTYRFDSIQTRILFICDIDNHIIYVYSKDK